MLDLISLPVSRATSKAASRPLTLLNSIPDLQQYELTSLAVLSAVMDGKSAFTSAPISLILEASFSVKSPDFIKVSIMVLNVSTLFN